MLPPERASMAGRQRVLDLTALTRRIDQIQQGLIRLAEAKTHSQAQSA